METLNGTSAEPRPLPLIGTISCDTAGVNGIPSSEPLSDECRRIIDAERATVRGDFTGGREFYSQVKKDAPEFLSAVNVAFFKALGSGDLDLFDELRADVAAFPDRYGTEEAVQAAEIYRAWVNVYLRTGDEVPDWIENPDLNAFPPAWRQRIAYLIACRLRSRREFGQARLFTSALLSLNKSAEPMGFAGHLVLKLLLAEICRGAGRFEEERKWCAAAVREAQSSGALVMFLGRVFGRKQALGAALQEQAPEVLDEIERIQEDFFRNRVRFHNHLTGDSCSVTLTVRQFFIGTLLKRGYRYKEIAERIGVGLGRFNALVTDLYDALGIHKDVELEGLVW